MSSIISIDSVLLAVPPVKSIFCARCYCIIHNCIRGITSHLNSCWDIFDECRLQAIIEAVDKTDVHIQLAEDKDVRHQWLIERRPQSTIDALHFLSVEDDALGCPCCIYAVKDSKCLREHLQKVHPNITDPDEKKPLKGVLVQAVTTENGGFRQYWRVRIVESATPYKPEPIRNYILRMEEESNSAQPPPVIIAREECLEPNPFVDRLLFRKHLSGLSHDALKAATFAYAKNNCPDLFCLFETMADLARDASTELKQGENNVLATELNRRKLRDKATHPFSPVGPTSLRTYLSTWQGILAYMQSLLSSQESASSPAPAEQQEKQSNKPHCVLTPRQARALQACIRLEAVESGTERQQRVTELFNSILQARLLRDDFESPAASALAAMAFNLKTQAWHSAKSYQGHITHFIHISLLMIYADAVMIPVRKGLEAPRPYCKGDETTGACVRCGTCTLPSSQPASQPPCCKKPLEMSAEDRLNALSGAMRSVVYVNPEGEIHRTAIVWAIQAQGAARQLRQEAPPEPTVEWRENDTVLVRNGVRVPLSGMRTMVGLMLEEAEELISRALLETSIERGSWMTGGLIPDCNAITDNINCTLDGWTLLDHLDNQEWAKKARFFIPDRIDSNKALRTAWRPNNMVFSKTKTKEWRVIAERLKEQLMGIYATAGGSPSRRTEVINLRFANSEGGPRDFFVYKGLVGFRSVYWKGYGRFKQGREVFRFLPRRASIIFLIYVSVIRPFDIDLERSNHNSGRPYPFLFTRGCPTEKNKTGPAVKPVLISVDKLTKIVEDYTQNVFRAPLNFSDFRHVLIGIGRKFVSPDLQKLAPEMLQKSVSSEDSEDVDHEAPDAFEEMAAHSASMGRQHYAVAAGPDESTWIETCFNICSQVHICIMPADTTRQRKRRRDRDSADSGGDGGSDAALETIRHGLQIRRNQQLASRALDENQWRMALRCFHVSFRKSQRDAMALMTSGKADKLVYMAEVGGGKSIVYMLPAFVQPDSVTVVVQPLRALQDDTSRRLTNAGISNVTWHSGMTEPDHVAGHAVLLVTPEAMATGAWELFADRCRKQYLIDRVVVDEVQEVLAAGLTYRKSLVEVVRNASILSRRLILLTGTLPPTLEQMFFSSLKLKQSEWTVLRNRTSRSNIRYEHSTVETPEEVVAFVEKNVKPRLQNYRPDGTVTRCILYVPLKAMAEQLGGALSCPYYTAARSEGQKAAALQQWEDRGGIIVATSALGYGIDAKGVVLVIQVVLRGSVMDGGDNEFPLITMLQGFGRGGRDGSPCTGILLSSGEVHNKDLSAYIHARCRREAVSAYLDGNAETCGFDSNPCDRCAPQLAYKDGRNTKKRRLDDGTQCLDQWNESREATFLPATIPGSSDLPSTDAPSDHSAAANPTTPSSSQTKSAAATLQTLRRQSMTQHSIPLGLAAISSGSRERGLSRYPSSSDCSDFPSSGDTTSWASTPSRTPGLKRLVPTPLRPGFDLATNVLAEKDLTFNAQVSRRAQIGDEKAARYCTSLNQLLLRLHDFGLCPKCYVNHVSGHHLLSQCPDNGGSYEDAMHQAVQELHGASTTTQIGKFSCCFTCLRPQIFCAKFGWCEKRKGYTRVNPSARCQTSNLFLQLTVALIKQEFGTLEDVVVELGPQGPNATWGSENQLHNHIFGITTSKHTIGHWLRERVRIDHHGFQAHNLFIVIAVALERMGKLELSSADLEN